MSRSLTPCALTFVVGAALLTPSRVAAQADTPRIPGVAAPVEIVRDRWGVPHIYAESTRDLFFAQGYNTAHDRLSLPGLSAGAPLR